MDTKTSKPNINRPTGELWMASLYRSATMPDGTKIQECISYWINISQR